MDPANDSKLFVMIVDEAHHSAVKNSAHDAFVNDLMWTRTGSSAAIHGPFPTDGSATEVEGKMCGYENLVTILVSATPACLLTADSRIPRSYFVPKRAANLQRAKDLGLQPYSIISPVNQRAAFEGPAKLQDMLWQWQKDGNEQTLSAATLQTLIEDQVQPSCIL